MNTLLFERITQVNAPGNLCPVCNNENEADVKFCRYCGAQLGKGHSTKFIAAIPKEQDATPATPIQADSFIDVTKIPQDGVGIHVAGLTKPLYIPVPWEVIIGRYKDEGEVPGDFLDLTDMGAERMGVSRRHVMIRRMVSGFHVIDLSSRNGTWLNAKRLTPHEIYPFPSGSQLRIGNLRLLIMYHSANTNAK